MAAGSGSLTFQISKTAAGFRIGILNGTAAVGALPGQNTFSAAVGQRSAGTAALLAKQDGTEVLLRKAVVENQSLVAPIPAAGEIRLAERGVAFADAAQHWSASSVSFVTARNLFQGMSDTAFAPNSTMTRGMLVTVLHRLEDEPSAGRSASFSDVAQSTWYATAVSWATQNGIVQGSDNLFLPNDPVTREQLATFLYRYAQSVGLSTAGRSSLGNYADGAAVATWAREAMEWSVSAGLINGKDDTHLDPKGKATRAEVATILERLVRRMAASR